MIWKVKLTFKILSLDLDLALKLCIPSSVDFGAKNPFEYSEEFKKEKT